jgi:CubicO group peptidase (beta-lactamase class C family)
MMTMRNTRDRLILATLLFLGVALQPPRGALGSELRGPGQSASGPSERPAPDAQRESEAGGDLAAKLAAIEKAVDARRRRLHVPGASLVIVKDDRVIYLKGLGFRDMERKLPVTPRTLFAIGSCTKAFTAMTVMMSAEDGKLSLEDSPKKYLPYFRLRDPESDARITISDLLCHRSGLGATDIAWYTGVLRPREVIRVAGQAKPTAKLGEKWQYQNVMFLAAGEVVAKAQKSPWRKVVTRRILRPLGMTATNTSVKETQRTPDHALGYTYNGETKQTLRLPMRDLANIAPAGAINSNAEEMAQWLRLMLGGGVFEGRRLISEKSFNELVAPHMKVVGEMQYGYGWLLRHWHGRRVIEHSGGIDGFNAQVALMPDQKLGLVLLTNISSSQLPSATMNAVWENLVGRPQDPPAAVADASAAPAAASAGSDEASGGAPAHSAASPAGEAGSYHLAEANIDVIVAFNDGKLTIQAPGQPAAALEPLGGRRYRIAPPAPENSFVTFRPSQKDPQASELLLEQGGGSITVVLTKQAETTPAPFTPPMTVEELMRKVIEAAGGEANLRKHRTMTVRFDVDIENQGLTGRGVLLSRAPNATAETITLFGMRKKIGTLREYYDGAQGGAEASFAPPAPHTGKQLADAAIAADFSPALNWKTLFKTVEIRKLAKVGDEEAYEVRKTPEKGNPVTDFIATRSCLLLKRESMVALPGNDGALPLSETFTDYRAVDGVMVPFTRVRTLPEMGDMRLTVKEVKFDARMPASAFRPGARR